MKDREAWLDEVHGVAKNQTRPSNWTATNENLKYKFFVLKIYILVLKH